MKCIITCANLSDLQDVRKITFPCAADDIFIGDTINIDDVDFLIMTKHIIK